MDAVILVYLITIFVVPIIMSLISCNIRNKSKKPTERKGKTKLLHFLKYFAVFRENNCFH